MGKILSFILLVLGMCVLVAPVSFAATDTSNDIFKHVCDRSAASNSAVCKGDAEGRTSANPLWGQKGFITNIINLISIVAGIIAVVVIIMAGFKLITSGGDSNAVSSARNSIIFASVGLVVAASAQLLVKLVLDKVG